jgi:hypothetical protein
MKIRSLAAYALVLCALIAMGSGAVTALADTGGKTTFNIGFEFSAGDTTFPAGNYELSPGKPTQFTMTIRNVDGGKTSVAHISSRLAPRNSGKAELVFDQEAGKMYLSEVHIPGTDGYYIAGPKASIRTRSSNRQSNLRIRPRIHLRKPIMALREDCRGAMKAPRIDSESQFPSLDIIRWYIG